MKWTQQNEDELQRLLELKQETMRSNRAPLMRLAEDSLMLDNSQRGAVVDWMIYNAEDLRDNLEPFDSGERAACAG